MSHLAKLIGNVPSKMWGFQSHELTQGEAQIVKHVMWRKEEADVLRFSS